MILCYSGRSEPSALAIAEVGDFEVTRSGSGQVNWGRARANTSLNPDISNSTNKRVMRELFAERGVPMPKLIDFSEHGLTFSDVPVYPCVGRPDQHTKGRGFWLCHNFDDVRRALRGTRRKRAATHFMEYVESEHEYRVHIFKGKSIRISEKSFFINEEGKKDYTTIKPTGKMRYVRQAAKQAVEALGLDFGAVDILVSGENNENVYVLEVNAAPGLGGSMPGLYAEIFQRWFNGEWEQ